MNPRFDPAVAQRNFWTRSVSQNFDVFVRINSRRESRAHRTLNRQPILEEKCSGGVEAYTGGLVHRRSEPDDGDAHCDFEVVITLVISVGWPRVCRWRTSRARGRSW